MPVEVPLGTEVTVRGVKAEFRGMGILVRAAARDAFTYDLVNGANDSLAIHIAARGEDTAMEVVIGESSALLQEGDAIAVSEPAAGRHEIRVLAGAPVFLSPVRSVALGPGEVWAWPHVADAAVAVSSGEDLRSAVGPKPALPCSGPVVRPASRTGLLDLGALTPLAPDPYWRLGMGGAACRIRSEWACEEPFSRRRVTDLPMRVMSQPPR